MTTEQRARHIWAQMKGSASSPTRSEHLGRRQNGAIFWEDHEAVAIAILAQALEPADALDLVSRAEVLRVLRSLGEQDADLALYGAADNARAREYGEAAATRACCAVALIPAARTN